MSGKREGGGGGGVEGGGGKRGEVVRLVGQTKKALQIR